MNVLSRIMSRHHWYMVRAVHVSPKSKIVISFWWNHWRRPDVRRRLLIAPVSGQGLGGTRK